jgi:cytochrome P450
MLSLDGARHAHHRGPFTRPFRSDEIRARLASFIQAEADRLATAVEPRGHAELRRAVAGPLAAAVMAETLGLGQADPARILRWYDGIVAAVQAEAAAGQGGPAAGPAGRAAFTDLAGRLHEVIAARQASSLLAEVTGAGDRAAGAAGGVGAAPLTEAEAISNAAVLMFGGIETTEGMIANALLHLLSHPAELELIRSDHELIPAAIEESLRLEPAAAVVDRYATADAEFAGATIRGSRPGEVAYLTVVSSPGWSALFPHSPCSVVPVSQLACPCRRLTSLTWFRDKRQRGEGSPTAQAAGPLARRWRLSRHRN